LEEGDEGREARVRGEEMSHYRNIS